MSQPLTLGTAGHIDHGKTALVAALTGVDTDRLPEERARGLTIVLGYAPLVLPSGRRVSVVDVPGHERFVRTMVAGATGIDAFMMVVAADDGVMPQTREHAAVLRGLGLRDGVVAVTKADLVDAERLAAVAEEARALLGDVPVVACSSRTGAGIDELRTALDALATRVASRAASGGSPRLHVDRVFTVEGRGTVVTGTLWSGTLGSGDELELLPAGTGVRVRGLQIHDEPVEDAAAGQRVAVNLVGVRAREVTRGDVLAAPGTVAPTTVLDCVLELSSDARHGERVHVHHGTRDVPARLVSLADDLWQLRLDRPVLALDGDRVVVRRPSPPDTLGGGVVLDAQAQRHGRRPEILERLRRRRDGKPEPTADAEAAPAADRRDPRRRGVPARPPSPALDDPVVAALEARLRDAGTALLSEAQLADDAAALRALRDAGRAVRVSGRLYGHADVVADATDRIVGLLRADAVTLAGVRDALGLSRKTAQALLEHLDAQRITRRLPDDRRVLAGRGAARA